MVILRSFQPRSQPALRRRRQLFQRLILLGGVSLLLVIFIFPSWRAAIIPTLSLGLVHPSEDLHLQTVRYYDLSEVQGTEKGWERGERVLMLTPLRDASSHLPMFFSHLRNLTYPHNLIDLAFLVSDSRDDTLSMLSHMLEEVQNDPDPKMNFGEISVIEKDFGQKVQQDVESRHGFEAQASRRKLMAQARNWLLSATLRPTHSWVYWRDADVETAPFTIIEDLMRHNKDVTVPSTCLLPCLGYIVFAGDANFGLQMFGGHSQIGSVENSHTTSIRGRNRRPHWPWPKPWMKTP